MINTDAIAHMQMIITLLLVIGLFLTLKLKKEYKLLATSKALYSVLCGEKDRLQKIHEGKIHDLTLEEIVESLKYEIEKTEKNSENLKWYNEMAIRIL